jgi:hypothetical protein
MTKEDANTLHHLYSRTLLYLGSIEASRNLSY